MVKIFITLLFFSVILNANSQKKTFLRIYDSSGKKIAKGFFGGVSDSTITVFKDRQPMQIAISQIGNIKTKRSIGHSILVTGVVFTIGTAASLQFGVTINDAGENLFWKAAAASIFVGTLSGVFLGGLGGKLKRSENFDINGNAGTWLLVKPAFDKMPVYKRLTKK